MIRKLKIGYFADGPWSHNAFEKIVNDDRFDIMKWRNEQIYHLRQKSLLTIKMQDKYFKNTISPLFNQEFPTQILFSFMFCFISAKFC